MPTTAKTMNKNEAAARLNLSTRRVLDFAKEGKIKARQERTPTSRNQYETVFDAADVERFARERHAPRTIDVGEKAEKPKRERRSSTEVMAAAVRAVLPALPAGTTPPPAAPRPWLTLAEAEEYSGLPDSFLLSLIEGGKLPACNVGVRAGGRYRVNRADLDSVRGEMLPARA